VHQDVWLKAKGIGNVIVAGLSCVDGYDLACSSGLCYCPLQQF